MFSVGTTLSATARAAASAEDPESLIKQGVELRRRGDDVRAEGYFMRAYQVARTPRSAAQLGLVELSLGEFVEAETHLSEALAAPDAWVRGNRPSLEQGRTSARQHLLRVELTSIPIGATLHGADGKIMSLPEDHVLWLAPGALVLRVEAAGRVPRTVKVNGAAGEKQKVDVALEAVSASPAQAASVVPADAAPPVAEVAATSDTARQTSPSSSSGSSGSALRVAGLVAGAAGVATGVVGAILLAKGKSKVNAINDAALHDRAYDPSNGNWQTLQNGGVGLLIGGGVAVAGGAVLYLIGRRVPATEETAVSFGAGSGWGALQVGGRF